MTALNNNQKKKNPVAYYHISRKLTSGQAFTDQKDYQMFLNFLSEYLTNPAELKNTTKLFTIRGQTYKGKPHQPQNFFTQIELIAYKLEPDSFNLLIKQYTSGTAKKFARALSTRYAIFFNKKHHSAGSLFKTPYHLCQVKDQSSLLELSRDFHRNHSDKDNASNHYYSSYPEYLGKRVTNWIKPQFILEDIKVNDYQAFVEGKKEISPLISTTPNTNRSHRIPEILFVTAIFGLFSSYSFIRIKSSSPSSQASTPFKTTSQNVLGEKEEETKTETPLPRLGEKAFIVIKIPDGSSDVNLRQAPSTASPIIGSAKKNDRFEFISEYPDWYQIILKDGTTGYVSSRYAEIEKENNP